MFFMLSVLFIVLLASDNNRTTVRNSDLTDDGAFVTTIVSAPRGTQFTVATQNQDCHNFGRVNSNAFPATLPSPPPQTIRAGDQDYSLLVTAKVSSADSRPAESISYGLFCARCAAISEPAVTYTMTYPESIFRRN